MIGLPAFGHQTNDYEEFRAMVAQTDAPDYLGLALYGAAQDRPPPHRQPRPAPLNSALIQAV